MGRSSSWALAGSACIFLGLVIVAAAWDSGAAAPPRRQALAEARAATTAAAMADLKRPAASGASSALAGEAPAAAADGEKKPAGPNLTQIWAVREWFINIAGGALCLGLLVLLSVCCFTQRGCFVYDRWIDSDRHRKLPEEEEPALQGERV